MVTTQNCVRSLEPKHEFAKGFYLFLWPCKHRFLISLIMLAANLLQKVSIWFGKLF